MNGSNRFLLLLFTLSTLAASTLHAAISLQLLPASQLKVTFPLPATDASATNLANYTLVSTNGGLGTITNAALDGTFSNAILSISGLTEGANYSLTVTNIRNRTNSSLVIVANE